MSQKTYNVLFLCTGNSARSILAEAVLTRLGKGTFIGFSAGSHPKSDVNPFAIDLLKRLDFNTEGLRSKSWDEFARPDAPRMDFIVTVCDNAAGEVCPIWPGQPITAHWGIEDPAAVEGNDVRKAEAFETALRELESRIRLFLNLPIDALERARLKTQVDAIGHAGAVHEVPDERRPASFHQRDASSLGCHE